MKSRKIHEIASEMIDRLKELGGGRMLLETADVTLDVTIDKETVDGIVAIRGNAAASESRATLNTPTDPTASD